MYCTEKDDGRGDHKQREKRGDRDGPRGDRDGSPTKSRTRERLHRHRRPVCLASPDPSQDSLDHFGPLLLEALYLFFDVLYDLLVEWFLYVNVFRSHRTVGWVDKWVGGRMGRCIGDPVDGQGNGWVGRTGGSIGGWVSS